MAPLAGNASIFWGDDPDAAARRVMKKASFRLGDIAFARSGDKGSSANIAVFARDEGDHLLLCDRLTSRVVKIIFSH
jgi:hypothetical protein